MLISSIIIDLEKYLSETSLSKLLKTLATNAIDSSGLKDLIEITLSPSNLSKNSFLSSVLLDNKIVSSISNSLKFFHSFHHTSKDFKPEKSFPMILENLILKTSDSSRKSSKVTASQTLTSFQIFSYLFSSTHLSF